MISSPVLSTQDDRDELLRGARSNVGLVADTIWAPIERDDSYRKLNRDLWKQVSISLRFLFHVPFCLFLHPRLCLNLRAQSFF